MNKILSFLVVDDDEDDREIFEIATRGLTIPVNVILKESAKDAMEYLHTSPIVPDAIFLDLNMPKIDGRMLLKELKADTKTTKIPVAIISTSMAEHDISETKTSGAVEFIIKPSDTDVLTLHLNNFIQSKLNFNQNEK